LIFGNEAWLNLFWKYINRKFLQCTIKDNFLRVAVPHYVIPIWVDVPFKMSEST
jgi:hypothetical protein